MWKLYEGDCIEVMKSLGDNSIDAVITDPPYELGFMGKKWDATGIAYNVEMWKEVLRVLKPGGHLLSFGGTRTYHRMVCAIEDAGFEIRDTLMWCYGSGFPKSLDISKAIDKILGAEREVIGIDEYRAKRIPHGRNKNNEGWNYGVDKRAGEDFKITIPATSEAQQWSGWGTALKPAHEPICLARKPLSEPTVAENVLKWGTGGLNIDACRIPTKEDLGRNNKNTTMMWGTYYCNSPSKQYKKPIEEQGRWPANLLFTHHPDCTEEECHPDCPIRMLDEQSGISKSTGGKGEASREQHGIIAYGWKHKETWDGMGGYGDKGGASRFFYCAKASRRERGEYNDHPTVKPLKLIRYLCRLITPPNGTILDLFAGAGTTLLAGLQEGFNVIGIEKEPHYCQITKRRLEEAGY